MAQHSELRPTLLFQSEPTTSTPTLSTRMMQNGRRLVARHERKQETAFTAMSARLGITEPEDARITGMTRSLYRRLLALNLRKPVSSERADDQYMPLLTA